MFCFLTVVASQLPEVGLATETQHTSLCKEDKKKVTNKSGGLIHTQMTSKTSIMQFPYQKITKRGVRNTHPPRTIFLRDQDGKNKGQQRD